MIKIQELQDKMQKKFPTLTMSVTKSGNWYVFRADNHKNKQVYLLPVYGDDITEEVEEILRKYYIEIL